MERLWKREGRILYEFIFVFGELGIIHKKKRSFCNFTALNNGNGKFIIKKTI
mgnify:FL=1